MPDSLNVLDPHRLRRISDDHPEWPLVLAAAAAWVFLAARPHAQAAGHHHGTTHGEGAGWLGLAAMVVAMMLPLMLASVREAALSGPWPRRYRAMSMFLAGYLGVWLPAMLLIDLAWRQLFLGGANAAVGTMIVAALWELTPAKRRQERGCGTGAQTTLFCTGLMAGGTCIFSCWALMALCVAFAHDVRVMAALFCIQLISRHRRAPAPAAVAVLVVCLASLALRMAGAHSI